MLVQWPSAPIADDERKELSRSTIEIQLERTTWFDHVLKYVSCSQTNVDGDLSCSEVLHVASNRSHYICKVMLPSSQS